MAVSVGGCFGCSAEELLTLGQRPASSIIDESSSTPTRGVTSETRTAPPSDSSVSLVSTSNLDSGVPQDAGPQSQGTTFEATDSGDGGSVTDASVPDFAFDLPVVVDELYSGSKDDNPTLTSDMTEIYFSSKRDADDTNLWWARRGSVDEPFSEPELLVDLSSSGFDTSPAVDGDGLTFWFSSRVSDAGSDSTLDIYRTRRRSRIAAWGVTELVVDLNSDADDIPRPTGANGLIMPLASRRDGSDYQTYFARRARVDAPFAPAEIVQEIHHDGMAAADAFLSLDGLTLLYNASAEGEPGDLYVATRGRLEAPFSNNTPLSDLNTSADERDPWLSPDGQTMYFASDRDGSLAIYKASRR